MTIDFVTGAPVTGDLAVSWVHGAPSGMSSPGPDLQIHAFDAHTFILRQDRSVSREAPFLFLLFGNQRALLLDTGATRSAERFPLRATVDGLIDGWLVANPRDGYELVVAHSHGHGDHVAGDEQFAGRARTTVVNRELVAMRAFFGFTRWPDEVVTFDLGGRVLEVMGSPGHHPAAVTLFDAWSGFLLTGDTVYPGRLYAHDMSAFVASLERMTAFVSERKVAHVVGCHIEMSRTAGKDYALGARVQPDEPPLQMTVAQLEAVRQAAVSDEPRPGVHAHADFIIYSGPCRGGLAKLLVRGLWSRLRGR